MYWSLMNLGKANEDYKSGVVSGVVPGIVDFVIFRWYIFKVKTKGGIKMRRSLSIFLASLIVAIGLTSSCSSYKDQKVKLYSGMQPVKIDISVKDFSPDFVELKIRIIEHAKLRTKWLYHIIEDEQENFISEGWYPITIADNATYTIKIKAKNGFSFESGKEYALCIGLRNPEQTIRSSNNYKCEVYQKFTIERE
jgi:hypothetical protein